MTSSVAINVSSKLIEPSTTSKSPSSVPEEGDEGEAFNKVLNEQTAKALKATDNEAATTNKSTKSSKKKGEAAPGDTVPAKGEPGHPAKLAVTAGPGPSNALEDHETITPSTSNDKVSTKSTTPPTTTLLSPEDVDAVGVNASLSEQDGDVRGATDSEMTDSEATDRAATDVVIDVVSGGSTEAATSELASLATRTTANSDPKSLSVEDDKTMSPTTATSGSPTPSLPLSSAAMATSTMESLSDAQFGALRATFETIGDVATPTSSSRTTNATVAPAESTSLTTSSAHRGDDATATVTMTSSGVTPTPTWTNAVRAAANDVANASSANDSPSLDVTDLATSISQAAFGADGSYTLNVAMHPDELGHVQAVVSLNGDDLHVAITPQTPTGHQALANAVDGLKSELARGGLNVNVSLRDPESQSGQSHDEPQLTPSFGEDALEEGGIVTSGESLAVSQIHLIL